MRNLNVSYIRTSLIGSVIGLILLAGTSLTATAQAPNREYRDYQRAQARAQRQYQDYLMTHSMRDYYQWQAAQRRAQEEYLRYQQSLNLYNNNGYYNNGTYYDNGYYNRTSYAPGIRYRIYTNGSYYMTDARGAEMLRQAVRNGYAQGYQQGIMARRYGRAYDYYNNNMYMNGLYGWQSYVDQSQYQYYFQQGFQRGFEDGYYSRNQYGYRVGSTYNILGSVLNTILNLAQE